MTEMTRLEYERSERRYATDATDIEWPLIAPALPTLRGLARARETCLGEVVNAIFYMLHAGGLPAEAAPNRVLASLEGAAPRVRVARRPAPGRRQAISWS